MPHPLWAPGRLDAAARLHGHPGLASGRRLRVLDVGCGAGGTALAVAARHPGWEVHGVDIDSEAILLGSSIAADAGLGNCRLQQADLSSWQPDGEYDLVLAHGLYSWVPDVVRQSIWNVLGRALAAGGLLALDFHALPGFRLRQVARDVIAGAGDADAARRRLTLVAGANLHEGAYRTILLAEAARLAGREESAIEHDELAPEVAAFAIREVVEAASGFGLDWIGSALPADWWRYEQPPTTTLDRALLPSDPLDLVELLDQVRGVAFHVALFGRGHAAAEIDPTAAGELVVERTPASPGAVDAGVTTARTRLQQDILDAVAHRSRPCTLADIAGDLVGALPQAVLEAGLQLATRGDVVLTTMPWETPAVAPRPRATALARATLGRVSWAPTLRHQHVDVADPMVRALLLDLDGTRTVDEIAARMHSWGAVHERTEDAARAATTLDSHLASFAGLGLLDG